MAYDVAILAEAQELYFAGQSAARIAGEMKKRHPESCKRICEKTVLKWISTPDAFNETWADKKAKCRRKAEEKRIDKFENEFGRVSGMLRKTTDIMMRRLETAQDFAPTNPEYTAQVLLQCLGKGLELLTSAPVGGQISGEHVRVLFEVLQADPDMGPLFVRKREELLKAVQDKWRAAGLEK